MTSGCVRSARLRHHAASVKGYNSCHFMQPDQIRMAVDLQAGLRPIAVVYPCIPHWVLSFVTRLYLDTHMQVTRHLLVELGATIPLAPPAPLVPTSTVTLASIVYGRAAACPQPVCCLVLLALPGHGYPTLQILPRHYLRNVPICENWGGMGGALRFFVLFMEKWGKLGVKGPKNASFGW